MLAAEYSMKVFPPESCNRRSFHVHKKRVTSKAREKREGYAGKPANNSYLMDFMNSFSK